MPLEYIPGMRIHPPRPEGAIPPSSLARYRGYIAQYKYNDVRTLVRFSPPDGIALLNRHLQPHQFYSMSALMRESLKALKLDPRHHHILDGGLLHRIGGIRDCLVLWDVLVHDGVYLVGETLLRRYEILVGICGRPTESERETGLEVALHVNARIWLAPFFSADLECHYRKALRLDLLEGLVLKDPASRLQRAVGERNNGSWQIRVRKPHVNYAF